MRGKGAAVDDRNFEKFRMNRLSTFFYKQQKRLNFFRCVKRFWAHLLQVSELHVLTGDIEAAEQGVLK